VDDIDRHILTALVDDGRLTYQELARLVRLSANAVADRVRRLRGSGVLGGYHAELDLAALGRTLVALTDVRLREDVQRADFERGLRTVPQVIWAAHTTGEYDYQLRLACTTPTELEQVAEVLRRTHGARELRSRVILSEINLSPARLLAE
jgi:Lrp/AsnC family leucine-responsive transcriptional regulator